MDVDAHAKEWQRFKTEDLPDLQEILAWWRESKPERDRYMEQKRLHEAHLSRHEKLGGEGEGLEKLGGEGEGLEKLGGEDDKLVVKLDVDSAAVAEDEARARLGLQESASAPQPSTGAGSEGGGPTPSGEGSEGSPAAPNNGAAT